MSKTGLIVAGVAVVMSAVAGYKNGYGTAENKYKAEVAALNEAAFRQSQVLQTTVNELDKKHYEELLKAENTISKLRNDVAAGNKRLSVKVKQPVCKHEDTTAPSMGHGAARAELDTQTGIDLIGIVIDGDRAIRKLNALQDWAEAVTTPPGTP